MAAHWRYKEKTKTSKQFEQKIAWLRELLAWRDEVADWSKTRGAQLDDTVYVLTPQVIDLPEGATPVDFAYALHSDPATAAAARRSTATWCRSTSRSRAASASKSSRRSRAGPSRDWLNPSAAS